MTYIKLEDVQKIYHWMNYQSDDVVDLMDKIDFLSSIDFEEMIKEEIEEINKRMDTERLTDEWLQILESQRFWLRKLLNKLPK